jgi:hypothetical protein
MAVAPGVSVAAAVPVAVGVVPMAVGVGIAVAVDVGATGAVGEGVSVCALAPVANMRRPTPTKSADIKRTSMLVLLSATGYLPLRALVAMRASFFVRSG